MKKYFSMLSFIISLSLLMSSTVYASISPLQEVTNSNITLRLIAFEENGGALLSGKVSSKDKLVVSKGDFMKIYNLSADDGEFKQKVFFTGGIGTYIITVYKHLYDNKYKVGPSLKVYCNIDQNEYLVPDQYIESDADEIISLANSLTVEKETSIEKAQALYNWVSENINYDYELLKNHEASNYDNDYGALKALESLKGVCFDYAALYTALGRSQGLQVKLIKDWVLIDGESKYHAWNEVYIPEEDRWVVLDTTFGATTDLNYFDY